VSEPVLPGRTIAFGDQPPSIEDAIRLHEQGRWREAERIYEALLGVGSNHYEVLLHLGALRAQQGRLGIAVELLQQAIALDPDDAESHSRLGEVLVAMDRNEEAVVACDRALAIDTEDALTHYNRGAALQALDHPADAVAAYEQAIAIERQFPAAHYNLGTALQALGKNDAAMAAYAGAAALKPDYAQAHASLARIQAFLGRHEAAIASFEKALAIEPDDLTILLGLAAAFAKLARHDEAIACFERALAIKPDQLQAHLGLGDVMRSRGRNDNALVHYERALSLMPGSAEILNNVGNALAALGRHDEAVTRYEQALVLTPDFAMLHHNLACSLEALNETRGALASYERALALNPELVNAHIGIGNVLRELGRFDEAHRAFETVIGIDPKRVAAYHGLGVSKRLAAGDPNLAALEAFAREPSSLLEEDSIFLHFALAKAYDDLGQHERSFAHLLEGNGMKRRQLAYDEANSLGFMDRCRDFFTPELLCEKAGHGAPSRLPIFIVGMMRSGSTLVEQILASHPQVFGGGERPHFEKSLIATLQRVGIRYTPTYLEAVRALDDTWIDTLAARYLRALTAVAPTATHITDKLLGNFINVGLIHLALPNARIIHTSRDPLDTCLSCFSNLFNAPIPYVYDLGELGRYYRTYERLMAHWHKILPEGVMIDVRYEDVVDDLEGQARRIVAHCGLEWDNACLDFHRTERPVRTASVAQVRQPIYASSVGRAQPLLAMLRPLIEALGEG